MYLVLIFTPLLASILSGFFGRKIGVSGSQWITCSSVVLTTILSILLFFEVAINNIQVTFELFTWIDSESLNIFWGFNYDALTASMLIPVLIVSSLVHIYSIGYMSHDPHNQRFFSYLSLFTFMMIILVTANNYLLMFVGWEGVGVCSYLLVSFWFTRIAANQSSISAFLTNRVGDCFLTIGIFAMLWSFGNIDYTTIFSLSPYLSENVITLIGICLLIGAMAKSSQVGLHVWLPMAMEGPTPVSALIHAATMVTAGVYLLMRSSPLIEYSSTVLLLCLWIGGLTTVFSSLIGLFQQDIKKVIAYSTMSQLGMMVIAVGLSSYNIALFHLVNHAFYKGLLFLGAGSVIHAVSDNQDFRRYGGLKAFLPLTYSVMLIASLSLVAFPYMTGFYSKDLILESAYGQFCFSSIVIYSIAVIGAMFTTLYSVKVLFLTFLTNPNGPLVNYKHAHEGDIFMSLPLIILALFSIFFGYITKDLFIGLGSSLFQDNSIYIYPLHEILIETEFAVPTFFKLLPLIFTLSFTFISIIFSEFFPNVLILFKFTRLGYNIFGFFNQRFLVELFYNTYITDVILKLGGQTTKVIDKGAIEYIGPYGLELGLRNLSNNIHKLDSNIITNYALYILSGFIIYILITYFTISPLYGLQNTLLFILLAICIFSINKFNLNNTTMYYRVINSASLVELESISMLIFNTIIENGKIVTDNGGLGIGIFIGVSLFMGIIFFKLKKNNTKDNRPLLNVHLEPGDLSHPSLGSMAALGPLGANLRYRCLVDLKDHLSKDMIILLLELLKRDSSVRYGTFKRGEVRYKGIYYTERTVVRAMPFVGNNQAVQRIYNEDFFIYDDNYSQYVTVPFCSKQHWDYLETQYRVIVTTGSLNIMEQTPDKFSELQTVPGHPNDPMLKLNTGPWLAEKVPVILKSTSIVHPMGIDKPIISVLHYGHMKDYEFEETLSDRFHNFTRFRFINTKK